MCSNIESFVFIDIETTGLPWQEKNRTKITEICLVAVLRRDLLVTSCGDSPPISKLSLFFNPRKAIHPEATRLTGLTNDLLRYAPTFEEKIGTINTFLEELPKPVCLVAHNGNKFDYKIILAEFHDANVSPPQHLLCVDSLIAFKEMFKPTYTRDIYLIIKHESNQPDYDNVITDDEDDWPELNVSAEDWEDIDELTSQVSNISCQNIEETLDTPTNISKHKKSNRKTMNSNMVHKNIAIKSIRPRNSFTLSALYRRILNKEAVDAHKAENDCLMLLECVNATKDVFIPWANRACVKLTNIQPIIRY